jgi:primosomal protein N' (replication factor Y) (superfamily II helicase)
MSVIRVALDIPVQHLFDYACENANESDIGRRVVVPFGTRKLVGVILEVTPSSELPAERLKAAQGILEDAPALGADWLGLARFCSSYYQKPIGEVILAVLPPRLRRTSALSARRKAGLAAKLPEQPVRADRAASAGHTLNPEQEAAYREVRGSLGRFNVFHLFGITGSGKTEIYLHLVDDILRSGRQALVLVPEIALTPALEGLFRNRFPQAAMVVQHSAMGETERARGWLDAQTGKVDIVLGTRLAVFVPLPRLGLVVVDEEQDASFKQREGLRYSARDVAVFRAREAGIPAVLVSATPSLETLQHALTGRYRLLRLSQRAHAEARLPAIRLVDTRASSPKDGISDELALALSARLSRGEQSLVFLNRRGYAPVLACNHCGWVGGCPRCSAFLVLHLRDRVLRCHHCGREERIPRACPQCGNLELVPFGRGTQRLEDSLRERFPQARVLRIDSDAAGGRVAGLIERAHAGEADILVGTQMLAKGHDFERVTLVGVVNADAGLFAADYRAPERLFAQLQQVAGRAGRAGLPGEVLVQTRFPHHPLYQALERHDYEGYAKRLLEDRRFAGFPPFMHEAALRAEASEMEHALGFLAQALTLAPDRGEVTVYDPAPASMPRVAALERAQLVVQSSSRPALQRFLNAWSACLYAERWARVRWHFDVDPIEF